MQPTEVLVGEEQAYLIMKTKFSAHKRAQELKEQMIALSEARNLIDVKNWWEQLPNADKSLVLSILQGIFILPVIWKMAFVWKTLIMFGVCTGTYYATKSILDLADTIEKMDPKDLDDIGVRSAKRIMVPLGCNIHYLAGALMYTTHDVLVACGEAGFYPGSEDHLDEEQIRFVCELYDVKVDVYVFGAQPA